MRFLDETVKIVNSLFVKNEKHLCLFMFSWKNIKQDKPILHYYQDNVVESSLSDTSQYLIDMILYRY